MGLSLQEISILQFELKVRRISQDIALDKLLSLLNLVVEEVVESYQLVTSYVVACPILKKR
jgi:hypothetical protein